jgi:ECF sigma factor
MRVSVDYQTNVFGTQVAADGHLFPLTKIMERRSGIIGIMTNVTQMLSEIKHSDPAAAERLLPLVYDELRKLAAVKLTQEKPGQTLSM